MTTWITKPAWQSESFGTLPKHFVRSSSSGLCRLSTGAAGEVPDLLCDVAEMLGSAEDKCKATLCVQECSGLSAINNNKDK